MSPLPTSGLAICDWSRSDIFDDVSLVMTMVSERIARASCSTQRSEQCQGHRIEQLPVAATTNNK